MLVIIVYHAQATSNSAYRLPSVVAELGSHETRDGWTWTYTYMHYMTLLALVKWRSTPCCQPTTSLPRHGSMHLGLPTYHTWTNHLLTFEDDLYQIASLEVSQEVTCPNDQSFI